jgi:hypothetical protein
MAGLFPTPTRLALLRDVDAGRVQMYTDRHTYLDAWGVLDARISEARAAGWVELDEPTLAHRRPWRLTDAGRAVLAARGGAR